jgi:CRISPR-associated endoribonuclease Cas6
MRLYFSLSANQEPVPFAYQHYLVGAFNKWLGRNQLHDQISLYSLSWLYGGYAENGAVHFPRGAEWIISLHDESLVPRLIEGALRHPEVCCGMKAIKITQQETPDFGGFYAFKTGSPVLAKSKNINGRVKHFVYSDAEADAVLTATLRHKMDQAELADIHKDVRVRFDRGFAQARTKLITFKGIKNRVSVCPIIVEGTPTAVQFAWTVGAGHSTGSGFGFLL